MTQQEQIQSQIDILDAQLIIAEKNYAMQVARIESLKLKLQVQKDATDPSAPAVFNQTPVNPMAGR